MIYSGKCGNCRWEIGEDWTLVISPVQGTDGLLGSFLHANDWPWALHAQKIRKVIIRPGVKAGKSLRMMFYNFDFCKEFVMAELDTSMSENLEGMFMYCYLLSDISSLAEWDTGNMVFANHMFDHCYSLEDASPLFRWNVKNLKEIYCMFANCNSLVNISGIRKWDLSKFENLDGLFSGCWSLPEGPLKERRHNEFRI